MLTREQNIFLAKKAFVELVYNTAYIEGCNVTFPQTQTIIDGEIWIYCERLEMAAWKSMR